MANKKYEFSLIKDRPKIKLMEKMLKDNDDFYIFENTARALYHNRKSDEISPATYELMRDLMKEHEYKLDQRIIKNAVLDAQTERHFDNRELYCINCSIALIILRDLPLLSDTQISNCAYTLSSLSKSDFKSFFSEVSYTEKLLCENEIYRKSDEHTKVSYRNSIEEYAKKNKISDAEAYERIGLKEPDREGTPLLKCMYFSSVCFVSLLILFLGSVLSKYDPYVPLLLLFPSYELAVQISNLIFSKLSYKELLIPKYEVDKVPDHGKTLTVITSLLCNEEEVHKLFNKLELYYLANKDDNIRFGILGDLPDANENIDPRDDTILDAAKEHTEDLNRKYGEHFFIFVRRRSYSQSERKFIGWERKRGAILELVRKIKSEDTSFSLCICNDEFIKKVKYVITLDSDTELGLGKAKRLIGAMLHPSNKPEISNGKVVSGYGIMQPNISTSLLSETASDFSMMLCGGGGTDVYASASFDIYQNIFGEGNFCGKGIFDVDCYHKVIDRAFADERILSHDLLEGMRLRTAYLSDVILSDACPSGVLPYFKRLHRWNRGDVQALAYCRKAVKDAEGRYVANPIDNLSKYKLTDNLRRIITPFAAVAAIILSGLRGERTLSVVLSFSLLYLIFPALVSVIFGNVNSERKFFSRVVPSVKRNFSMGLFNICSLFHTAYVSADSCSRAFFRMCFSKKKLLEWTTASEADKLSTGIVKYLLCFSDSMVSGLALILFYPYISVKLLGVLWFLFPFWSMLLSKKKSRCPSFSKAKKAVFTKYAFDMWKFYKENAGEGDNYLPPDNVQLSPTAVTAHRTSPTNIGLCLLSTLAARDFSFIDSHELCRRLSATLNSVNLMQKYCGHLYNWYDTESLEPIGKPYVSTVDSGNFCACLVALKEGLYKYLAEDRGLSELINTISKILSDTDFKVLYNERRDLFCISCDAENSKKSENCYDILMSESRIGSYYAIAMGEVPPKHWAKLQRTPISDDGFVGLVSWSGTAFEYFMPTLLLPLHKNSLHYEALRFAFYEQHKKKKRGIFGKSESGYYAFDRDMNYQYKAHGVQSLGLAGGLDKEKVYSPYSSFLFLAVSKNIAPDNLQKMKDMGIYGKYGFYEAVDFSPTRVKEDFAVIRWFMAHHVGMSMIACANACFDNIFINRFMSNRYMASAEELLTEKIPANVPVFSRPIPRAAEKITSEALLKENLLVKKDPKEEHCSLNEGAMVKAPGTALLSNGTTSLVCSSKGDILLKYKDIDICQRDFGDIFSFGGIRLYFEADGKIYGATKNSYLMKCDNRTVKYKLISNNIRSETSFAVSPDTDCLAISFSAAGEFCNICPMLIFEPKLYSDREYRSHPAYRRLFTEAYFDKDDNLLIFKKRSKAPLYCAVGFVNKNLGLEFISRKEGYLPLMYGEEDISALLKSELNGKAGPCIDPICAVKRSSASSSGKYKTEFLIAFGESRDAAIQTIRKARDIKGRSPFENFKRNMYGTVKYQMFSSLLDKDSLKLSAAMLTALYYDVEKAKSADRIYGKNPLYMHGISGDLSMITVYAGSSKDITDREQHICECFIKAYKYLRLKGEDFDMVFVTEDGDSYSLSTSTVIKRLCGNIIGNAPLLGEGKIYTVNSESKLFEIFPRAYFKVAPDTDIDKLVLEKSDSPFCRLHAVCKPMSESESDGKKPENATLITKSGYFTPNGFVCEKTNVNYPWSYCYCGPQFGTILTQNSLGFTFFENSREKRISEWRNDPYHETGGERLLLYADGKIYDLCACSDRVYFTCGCAIYSGKINNIKYKVYVGCHPLFYAKLISLEFTNCGLVSADISVKYETVYAMAPEAPPKRLIRILRYGNEEFAANSLCENTDMQAYKYDIGGTAHSISPDSTVKCGFVFGVCRDRLAKDYKAIRDRFRSTADIEKAFCEYSDKYSELLSKIKIKTDDEKTDILFNRYVPYQAVCDRLRARCGFFQPGGAYGFRDQLQDSLCLIPIEPNFAKYQILRCTSHQYEEGDVMHWWHNDRGISFGVRTKIADDPVWLAYALCEYVCSTGDTEFCRKNVVYLKSPVLDEKEKDRYERAVKSDLKESVFDHCVRGLELSLKNRGSHGLSLFGNGDWNDGMNEVGKGGESIWLSMFLAMTLKSFSELCRVLNKAESAERYIKESLDIIDCIEKYGYSGKYYIRGFYGDGKAFGTEDCTECAIDLIPQAFASLALPNGKRRESAISEARKRLYKKDTKILQLLDPPFDGLSRCPGYIGDYPSGIRENGGEYCHGALFFAFSLAKNGYADDAYEILETLNPLSRYSLPLLGDKYYGDPYSIPGDIMSNSEHEGRCGWNHYTGSAGWYHRVIREGILGIRTEKGGFRMDPRLPKKFGDEINVEISLGKTRYAVRIFFSNTPYIHLDRNPADNFFPLDGKSHFVEIGIEKNSEQ